VPLKQLFHRGDDFRSRIDGEFIPDRKGEAIGYSFCRF
jgi:hypothetical protein